MRIVAYGKLRDYWMRHPQAEVGLRHWFALVLAGDWQTTLEVVGGIGGSKALSGDRVRFAIQGGAYRLIASFDFRRGIAYVKFIGTHAEYDRVDALTVTQF